MKAPRRRQLRLHELGFGTKYEQAAKINYSLRYKRYGPLLLPSVAAMQAFNVTGCWSRHTASTAHRWQLPPTTKETQSMLTFHTWSSTVYRAYHWHSLVDGGDLTHVPTHTARDGKAAALENTTRHVQGVPFSKTHCWRGNEGCNTAAAGQPNGQPCSSDNPHAASLAFAVLKGYICPCRCRPTPPTDPRLRQGIRLCG